MWIIYFANEDLQTLKQCTLLRVMPVFNCEQTSSLREPLPGAWLITDRSSRTATTQEPWGGEGGWEPELSLSPFFSPAAFTEA